MLGKSVVLEYYDPYVILPVSYKSLAIMKDDVSLLEISNSDFVIQTGENDFVFTTAYTNRSWNRDVWLIHKNLGFELFNEECTYFKQKRHFEAFDTFPLKRVGQKFLIPGKYGNEGDAIYNAKNKWLLCGLLGIREILKISEVILENKEYFKILDKVYIGENRYGDVLYENFIGFLGAEDDSVEGVISCSNSKFYSLTKMERLFTLDYINQLKQVYYSKRCELQSPNDEYTLNLLKAKKEEKR